MPERPYRENCGSEAHVRLLRNNVRVGGGVLLRNGGLSSDLELPGENIRRPTRAKDEMISDMRAPAGKLCARSLCTGKRYAREALHSEI